MTVRSLNSRTELRTYNLEKGIGIRLYSGPVFMLHCKTYKYILEITLRQYKIKIYLTPTGE